MSAPPPLPLRVLTGLTLVAIVLAAGEAFAAAPDPVDAPDRAAAPRSPTIELRGDRQHAYTFAAVYHRFDQLEVHAEGISANAARRVRVTLERIRPTGEPREKLVILRGRLAELETRRTPRGMRVQGAAPLGEPGRRLPVGRYRVKIWLERDAGYEPMAAKPLFLIFNARHAADREVHKADPDHWLRPTLNIVQLVGGQLTADPWSLDIHDPEVFELAMSLADGARTGVEAAERMIIGAVAEIEGHWPNLPDTDGHIPEASPETDPDWQAGEVTSAARRLRMNDPRGQCFDYAMLYVAMLRSVGVPARTVTSIDPAPMPHPDDPSRDVQWDYHVWAEVYLNKQWWANDVTYLDEPLHSRLPRDMYPGLQKPHDVWFARGVGPNTRLWAVEHGLLRDVSDRYGGLTDNDARQLVRARIME